jgi:mono/diheme cytochrome c family protein
MAACLAVLTPIAARASPASIERGRWLAGANCASCHAVAQESASPDPDAPPFRNLRQAYPTRNLDEIFADGVLKDHAAMPQFAPGPADIGDLLDYLKTIQVKGGG